MDLHLELRSHLTGTARTRSKPVETKTVRESSLERYLQDGWEVLKRSRRSIRLKREKPPHIQLFDRTWTFLYRAGFDLISRELHRDLVPNGKPSHPETPIDVVAADSETAVAIRILQPGQHIRGGQLAVICNDLAETKPALSAQLRQRFPQETKRQIAVGLVVGVDYYSEADKRLAHEKGLFILEPKDLTYYESLSKHLGPAARFLLLADLLADKAIPGLSIRVPAIKSRLGETTFYTFSIAPEYLLKISYVSHRAKGRASDIDTYQRMLSRGRLSSIQGYISKDGVFPTNIVINIDKKRLTFQKISQETNEYGTLGWLDIRASYKSAWIIDGQHRLFAYSGHEKAATGRLTVLAFEGLPPSRQAGLFIDINAKQKRVKQSLLQELHAKLHWDSEDPEKRVSAIISRTIQILDTDRESPFFQRIQTADAPRQPVRCVSLTSFFGALEKGELFIAKKRDGHVVAYGAFWAGSNENTLERTLKVLNGWFSEVRSGAADWWDRGSGEGGGLAMNDGVAALVGALRSIVTHLEQEGADLREASDHDLVKTLAPFAAFLGQFLGAYSEQERRAFRELRGSQGQGKRLRLFQKALHGNFPSFNPPGLAEYLREEKAQTNIQGKTLVDDIESLLQQYIIGELKREFGEEENLWWNEGIPLEIRKSASDRAEEDKNARGGREHYVNLIDYRKIVMAKQNWGLFDKTLSLSGRGREKGTDWMVFLNERRKVLAHPSSGVSLSLEDLGRLQSYRDSLHARIRGSSESEADHDETDHQELEDQE